MTGAAGARARVQRRPSVSSSEPAPFIDARNERAYAQGTLAANRRRHAQTPDASPARRMWHRDPPRVPLGRRRFERRAPPSRVRARRTHRAAARRGPPRPPPRAAAMTPTPPPQETPTPYAAFDVNHVISTGQSNSVAHEGRPVISTSQPFSNIMFDVGVMTAGVCEHDGCRTYQKPTSFVPLTEGDSFWYPVETMSSGLANEGSMLATKTVPEGQARHPGEPRGTKRAHVLVSPEGRVQLLRSFLSQRVRREPAAGRRRQGHRDGGRQDIRGARHHGRPRGERRLRICDGHPGVPARRKRRHLSRARELRRRARGMATRLRGRHQGHHRPDAVRAALRLAGVELERHGDGLRGIPPVGDASQDEKAASSW